LTSGLRELFRPPPRISPLHAHNLLFLLFSGSSFNLSVMRLNALDLAIS